MANKNLPVKMTFKTKVALILFGLFLFFVLLEVGLRLGGFILLSMQEHKNRETLKHKGAYRIICLGESTTQGQYPLFLEEILNQRNIGVRFYVIDEGRAGTNTQAILSHLESYLEEYHPDLVVAMMGINDWGNYLPCDEIITSRLGHLINSFRSYKLARLLWPNISKKISLQKDGDLNPENDRSDIRSVLVYLEQNKFGQAEEAFRRAIKGNPNKDKVYLELGWFYREQGKYFQAENSFKRALELNPKNDKAYTGLGLISQLRGKFPQAEDLFGKAIDLNPKNDYAYYRLGLVYQTEGKFSSAENAFNRLIALNPKNDRGYGVISVLYAGMGKPELAKEYAEKAERLRAEYYRPVTVNNYHKLKEILDKRGIRLLCVQYPMRSLELLKSIFKSGDEGVIFVDNQEIFKEEVKKAGIKGIFVDMFAGDFGHCTAKGNRILAGNIAEVILKEIFSK